ncbi:MAG: Flp family type IVb pilin [Caulobacterales bacterium]|jgi:Flp pilus assembly pilin Flp
MNRLLLKFLRDRSGGPALEYSMIGVLIAVVLVSALTSMGNSIENMLAPATKAIGTPKA